MHQAFIDESGTPAPFKPSDPCLVVAIVAASPAAVRGLELLLKRLRRKYKVQGEMKAKLALPGMLTEALTVIAEQNIAIIAVIVDKRTCLRRPDDPEDWYRDAVAQAVEQCVLRWPQIQVALDRRYTNKALRTQLELAINRRLEKTTKRCVRIEQKDSKEVPGLQAVDFVAWAIHLKYAMGDDAYFALVQDRIVWQHVIEAK